MHDPRIPDRTRYYAQHTRRGISPGAAAVLSFFLPGLGQMCQGRIFFGLFCLLGIPLAYFIFVIPGIIAHVACVCDAAQQ